MTILKFSKPLVAGIIVVILIAAIAGYALVSLNNEDNSAKDTTALRIGYLVGDAHQMSRLVADNTALWGNQTLFAKYGVNVTYPNPGGYASGGDVMTAFQNNQIDFAWLGSAPAISKSLNADINITIVASANSEGTGLVVKSGINSWSDLVGKTIGTPGGTTIQQLYFLTQAKAHGLNVAAAGTSSGQANTVYWTAVAPNLQLAAMKSGQIDGGIAWEPYSSDAILDGTAHILEWSNVGWGDHPCCVLAVKTSYAIAHPEVVERVLKAHTEATNWINAAIADPNSSNYKSLLTMGAAFSGTNDADIQDSLSHMQLTYAITDSFKSGLTNFTQMYLDQSMVTQQKLTDKGAQTAQQYIDMIVDSEYLNKSASIKPVSG